MWQHLSFIYDKNFVRMSIGGMERQILVDYFPQLEAGSTNEIYIFIIHVEL